MRIGTKLTLFFLITAATILAVFASIIYFVAKKDRESEFFKLLTKEAITKANLLFAAKIDQKILQDIYHNNQSTINEVEVAIYDEHFALKYHDAVEIDHVKESPSILESIKNNKNIQFYQEGWQVVGLLYNYKGQNYYITAAAYDQYGYQKLQNLLRSSIIVFIISILGISIIGRYFSSITLSPFIKIINVMSHISAKNMHKRLRLTSKKDEISELSTTFNKMLDRLEQSFTAQKSFVSNISHELRTPLAAMITELELAQNHEKDTQNYKETLQLALSDAHRINKIINGLLDLAKASYDRSEITFKGIRIDETILEARKEILRSANHYTITIHIAQEITEENKITTFGNEYLLKVALLNLMENACKFSNDHSCQVSLFFVDNQISIKIKDSGIGMDQDEMRSIFKSFYRGKSKYNYPGSGIGLSLTKKIISLHQGNITVESQQGKGSIFTIQLPSMIFDSSF